MQGLVRVEHEGLGHLLGASGRGSPTVPRWCVEPPRWDDENPEPYTARPAGEYIRRETNEEWPTYAARVAELAGPWGLGLGYRDSGKLQVRAPPSATSSKTRRAMWTASGVPREWGPDHLEKVLSDGPVNNVAAENPRKEAPPYASWTFFADAEDEVDWFEMTNGLKKGNIR